MRKRKYLRSTQFESTPEDRIGVARLEHSRFVTFGLYPRGKVYGVGGPLADSDVEALLLLPSLVEVLLTGPWMGDELTDVGFRRLMSHPKLQIFGCAYRQLVTDSSAAALAVSGRVRWLCFNGCQITNQGVEHISTQTQLLNLNLANTKITADCIAALCNLTNLRRLTLKGNALDESVRAELLSHLPKCRELLI